jgi:hypothetical protein
MLRISVCYRHTPFLRHCLCYVRTVSPFSNTSTVKPAPASAAAPFDWDAPWQPGTPLPRLELEPNESGDAEAHLDPSKPRIIYSSAPSRPALWAARLLAAKGAVLAGAAAHAAYGALAPLGAAAGAGVSLEAVQAALAAGGATAFSLHVAAGLSIYRCGMPAGVMRALRWGARPDAVPSNLSAVP